MVVMRGCSVAHPSSRPAWIHVWMQRRRGCGVHIFACPRASEAGDVRRAARPDSVGGTVDGIRALAALGIPPTTRDLRDGIDWIRKQQLRSGGFCSCEIDYVAAESTSWTLIMFGELGIDEENDRVVKEALHYLRSCIGSTGGVSTTPDDASEPRKCRQLSPCGRFHFIRTMR